MSNKQSINYILHLADNALILSHRNSEWCGHGPILEQDIAITNISLDLIGQSRNLYQYAAAQIGNGSTEDSLAYLRKEREFRNLLLCEQPNIDWAQTILRQYLFSEFQKLLYGELQNSRDETIAAIAEKSLKEISYHVRWSSEWVIRLGDGTTESHERMENAVYQLWRYTGEMFIPAEFEPAYVKTLEESWLNKVKEIFTEATIKVPENVYMQSGGKSGKHTEYLGFILADLQYIQRTYPGAEW